VCGMSLYEAKPGFAIPSSLLKTSSHPETIIPSFGANDESAFKAEMLGRIPSAHIFAFEVSVDKFGPQLPASYTARAHFHKVGLGAKDGYDESP
jgi:hypothetical protein